VGDALRQSKLERIDLFEGTLQTAEISRKGVRIVLNAEAYEVWLGFFNDMRLLLGTRLDVQEGWEPDEDSSSEEWLYYQITYLQCILLECDPGL